MAVQRAADLPRETVERILAVARRAPSGSNIQPWKVIVLTGAARDGLCAELMAIHAKGDKPSDGSYDVAGYRPSSAIMKFNAR